MESKTVLVVDDDADTRQAYALLLQRAGYGVLEAAHGGDAIRLARERSPDLIMLDLGMPVVDGFEAATSLREYRDTAEIPILAITGKEPAQTPERLPSVCNSMLRKPCSCRQILTQVRRLIGPAAQRRAS